MATPSKGKEEQRGSGPSLVLAAAVLTPVAILAGGACAYLITAPPAAIHAPAAAVQPVAPPAASRFPKRAVVKPLASIVTNLASHQNWIRLEASIVVPHNASGSDVLGAEIAEDLTAFLRTVAPAQLEGASGLRHLREDLEERVAIRTSPRAHSSWTCRRMSTRVLLLILMLALPTAAAAQVPNLEALFAPQDASATGRIVQLLAAVTVLSVAPGLLMMVTCFTRFVIAFSFLRAGLGLQTTPSNLILVSLALFMTMFVMAPTFDSAWQGGLKPLTENKLTAEEGYARITAPFRDFMRANVREKDIGLSETLCAEKLGRPVEHAIATCACSSRRSWCPSCGAGSRSGS
jgi:flagellar FliP-like protein